MHEQPELALAREPQQSIVAIETVRAQKSSAAAFTLACSLSGLEDKEIYLALGIDAAAHRGGLAGPGSTIAVLGTGIDVVYPRGNAALAADIAAQFTRCGNVLGEHLARLHDWRGHVRPPPLRRHRDRHGAGDRGAGGRG